MSINENQEEIKKNNKKNLIIRPLSEKDGEVD